MLVYLDSGDIANLERLLTRDPEAFAAFLESWTARSCALALSLHHAQEISQLSDDASRERRLAVLARFPDIRYEPGGSYKVVRLEALTQLFARLDGIQADYLHNVGPRLFQERGLDALATTVREEGPKLRRLQAEQLATSTIRGDTRGLKIPHSYRKQTRDKVDLKQVSSVSARTLAVHDLTPLTRAVASPILDAINAHLASAPNVRVAFERAYGLEGLDVIHSVDDEDIHRVATFFSVAREVAAEYAGEIGADTAPAVSALDPYECPGVCVEMSVSRAQDTSSQAPDPSDEPDRAHMTFLPYVDAMFADRRTVGFLEQSARSSKRSILLSAQSRLARSSEPVRLLEAIDGIARNAA